MKWIIYTIFLGFTDPIHDVEVISRNEAIVYTYGTGKVLRTTDAGNSWKEVARIDSVYLEQVEFIDKKNGWIVGDRGRILRTKNGGSSWEVDTIKLPGCDRLLTYGLKFTSNKNGFASGGCLDGRSLKSKMLTTTDGGATWTEMEGVKSFYHNIEQNGKTLWATSDNEIARFVDNKWTPVFTDSAKKVGQIRDIEFNGTSIAAVSFNGYLIVSNDNGVTWNSTKITENRLRSIKINDSTWIAGGDANKMPGTVHISSNSGRSWRVDEEIKTDIHRLFVRDNFLWAVGKQGFMAKTALQ